MVAFIILFLLALFFELSNAVITLDSSFFWILLLGVGLIFIVGELLISKEERRIRKIYAEKIKSNTKNYVITSKEELDKVLEEIFKEEFKDKED
jgi:uncharacterized membrane protein YbhN (UPF0104 family)